MVASYVPTLRKCCRLLLNWLAFAKGEGGHWTELNQTLRQCLEVRQILCKCSSKFEGFSLLNIEELKLLILRRFPTLQSYARCRKILSEFHSPSVNAGCNYGGGGIRWRCIANVNEAIVAGVPKPSKEVGSGIASGAIHVKFHLY